MKKVYNIFIVFIILNMALILTSCKKGKINMNEPVYAQIVLKSKEKINLELFYDKAPLTVENFVKLAKDGYYKNTIFHRVINDFMIQTGGYIIEDNNINELPKTDAIYGEFMDNGWNKNDIKHELGVISMARTQVMDSATSQFFLCSTDCSFLNNKYAAFGKTTDSSSNDVILRISEVKTYALSYAFQDFPNQVIEIENIYISNKKYR